jgi:hypothetical protein
MLALELRHGATLSIAYLLMERNIYMKKCPSHEVIRSRQEKVVIALTAKLVEERP